MLAPPLQLVEDRVLRLLAPVVHEDVLPQLGELGVGRDARAVVRHHEQLDEAGEAEHRPGGLAQHRLRHGVRLGHEAVARGHVHGHHRFQAPEQLLVLDLFVGGAHQRLERLLVAEPVVPAHFQELRADEALDQAEDVGVGAALDLAHQAPSLGVQGAEALDERQAVGQELAAEIEFAAADHVAVDVPAHPLGRLDGHCVTVHGLPLLGCRAGVLAGWRGVWARRVTRRCRYVGALLPAGNAAPSSSRSCSGSTGFLARVRTPAASSSRGCSSSP